MPGPRRIGWRTVVSSLVLGAAVNIAVCWAIALWTSATPYPNEVVATMIWPASVPGHWPVRPTRIRRGGDLGITVYRASDEPLVQLTSRFGLPFRGMGHSFTGDVNDPATHVHHDQLAVPAVLTRSSSFTALPLRPLWPGFIVNTLLWATLAFFTITGVRFQRGHRRRRRGRCSSCGYDMRGGTTPCPECGAA